MRRTECVWEDTPLRDFFDRYFNILQNLVFGSDIVFELRYMQPKMPKVLRLPKSHMMQVLLNLGSNAIKYDGKEITLLVDYREEEKELVVEVQDRGLGISDEFVRSRPSETGPFQGVFETAQIPSHRISKVACRHLLGTCGMRRHLLVDSKVELREKRKKTWRGARLIPPTC